MSKQLKMDKDQPVLRGHGSLPDELSDMELRLWKLFLERPDHYWTRQELADNLEQYMAIGSNNGAHPPVRYVRRLVVRLQAKLPSTIVQGAKHGSGWSVSSAAIHEIRSRRSVKNA